MKNSEKVEFGFGFWFYKGKLGFKESNKCEEILLENNIGFKRNNFVFNFDYVVKDEEILDNKIEEVKNLMLKNGVDRYVIYRKS